MKKILIALLLCFSTTALSNNCEEIRAAFSIGVTSTSAIVAKVNTCLNTVGNILLDKEISLDFLQELESNGKISSDFQAKILETVGNLKEEAAAHSPKSIIGVGSTALSYLENEQIFATKIERRLGVKFHLIDKEKRAILGYLAAAYKFPKSNNDIVVWNIDEDSLQLTYLKKDNTFDIFEGKLSGRSFKNMVISAVRGKDYKAMKSPNPLGNTMGKKTFNLSSYYAKTHVPSSIQKALKKSIVIGIGPIHFNQIKKQVAPETEHYTRKDVTKEFNRIKLLSSKEIGGVDPDSSATNFALVAGFMSELKIEKIIALNANIAYGVLTNQEYWK